MLLQQLLLSSWIPIKSFNRNRRESSSFLLQLVASCCSFANWWKPSP
ncbi:unnamed protein product [Acanthoscelides obtectus]|uniref:Uncharacterized protein n=1 Tax=Acanthoscelides obtectus TaxID=200917 RepID=A0A9P0M4Y2_ACAOB|nr:unnamed protein product [Acanthoscelides obtectus]CAK1648755.1 hypothetical protein AOBTE_LOCUS15858 [Acanthoscelides obtectus]